MLAGAGSGKTRVITTRIAYLISRGVAPENILGVTFTNKAAAEMRERVGHVVPRDVAKRVNLGTFHALGVRLLRAEIGHLGFDPRFTILDEADKRRVMRDVLKELRLGADRSEQRVLAIVSKAKNARTSPARLPEAKYNPEMPRAQKVFDLYNRQLRNLNAVDFDDLLLLPTRIFDERPDVRDAYRERFRYVLVDEYQDTNPIQMHLLSQLVGPPYNLMAVGDDDQSIYGFRGAVADNILRFGDHYPGTTVVALEQNYRSVGAVLDLANAVIAKNTARHPKRLWSQYDSGEPVRLVEYDDEHAEAEGIAELIVRTARDEGRAYDAFAILYRSNGQAASLEEALRQQSVPYRMLGGQSLFDRKEIKDTLAYLRLLLNSRDELSLRRVINFPPRGVGVMTLSRLDERAKEQGRRFGDVVFEALDEPGAIEPKAVDKVRELFRLLDTARTRLRTAPGHDLSEIARDLVKGLRLEEAVRSAEKNPNIARIRWQGVEELLDRLDTFAASRSAWAALDDYVQIVTLDTSNTGRERDEEGEPRVTLATMHSSKGLEFPIVYLCGLNDGVLPHENALDEGSSGVAEERRLFYVGVTRARERLTLTRYRLREVRGSRERCPQSRFLEDIPPGLLDLSDAPAVASAEEQRATNAMNFARMRALLDD
ncbi:MAG: UvrD-helicase domain-containing protein [Myxococcales bacterium]|nr:UvrD-helicase domain-containing protein [Myxococcales bacterium]